MTKKRRQNGWWLRLGHVLRANLSLCAIIAAALLLELTMENMAWAEGYDLTEPDSLMSATRLILNRNPNFLGVGIPCIPNLFAQKGYWYEPFSMRMADGSIVTKQVGGPTHDYIQKKFFRLPLPRATDTGASLTWMWTVRG